MKNEVEDVKTQVVEEPVTETSAESGHSGKKDAAPKTEVLVTEFFMTLLNEAVGSLPYNTRLTSNTGQTISLNNFVTFLEQHTRVGMTVAEMNLIINFMYSLPFRNVRKIMNIMEKEEEQPKLWTIKES